MEYINAPYDFIEDGNGELMLELRAFDGNADEDNAGFIFDGVLSAILVRDGDHIISIPRIPEPYRALLKPTGIIIVSEMEGDDFSNVFEARENNTIRIIVSDTEKTGC